MKTKEKKIRSRGQMIRLNNFYMQKLMMGMVETKRKILFNSFIHSLSFLAYPFDLPLTDSNGFLLRNKMKQRINFNLT